DIREVLDDANINYDDLKDITLAGAAYQVLEKDPTPDRRIVNGSVAVRREGVVSPSTLIDPLNIDVNSLVGYENALLSASGVAVINDILSDIVAEIRTGQQAQNTTVTFIITGRSEPVGTPTDFKWELKLYFSILGALKIDMVEF
ncbi:MAG: hypothetical protein KAY24_18220, partial [Candidatus Eisenbacteria sp.]|nr:hypothetical protein [Candidatus Eisenbacteria bacterium]